MLSCPFAPIYTIVGVKPFFPPYKKWSAQLSYKIIVSYKILFEKISELGVLVSAEVEHIQSQTLYIIVLIYKQKNICLAYI